MNYTNIILIKLWRDIMNNKSIKLMLLGISLMIAGIGISSSGILADYTFFNTLFFVNLGFIISLVGFFKKD